jgi:hypothetical protein
MESVHVFLTGTETPVMSMLDDVIHFVMDATNMERINAFSVSETLLLLMDPVNVIQIGSEMIV